MGSPLNYFKNGWQDLIYTLEKLGFCAQGGKASNQRQKPVNGFFSEGVLLVACHLSLLWYLALPLTLSLSTWHLDLSWLNQPPGPSYLSPHQVWPPCQRLWQFRNRCHALAPVLGHTQASEEEEEEGGGHLECNIWEGKALSCPDLCGYESGKECSCSV